MFNLIDEKLRYQKRLFQSLVEQSSDMIIFVNREGIVIYQNPAVEISLGFKAEERVATVQDRRKKYRRVGRDGHVEPGRLDELHQ